MDEKFDSKDPFRYTIICRGLIIEKAILIENLLDSILIHYFNTREAKDFYEVLILHERFNTSFKIDIIDRLGLFKSWDNKLKKDLERVFSLRNKAAHSKPIFQTEAAILVNPRKRVVADMKRMVNEMSELVEKLQPELGKTILSLIKHKNC